MKTYQLWLILEEVEGTNPVIQIEACQLTVTKTVKGGLAVFQVAQDILADCEIISFEKPLEKS